MPVLDFRQSGLCKLRPPCQKKWPRKRTRRRESSDISGVTFTKPVWSTTEGIHFPNVSFFNRFPLFRCSSDFPFLVLMRDRRRRTYRHSNETPVTAIVVVLVVVSVQIMCVLHSSNNKLHGSGEGMVGPCKMPTRNDHWYLLVLTTPKK